MVQNFSRNVQYCLQHAEDCAERARREPDPLLRRDFFDMEMRWLKLARGYRFLDQVITFMSYGARQRANLTESLVRSKGMMDELDAKRPTES
jgi:hypothetical protein